MNAPWAIDVDDIYFNYKNGHQVLKGLSCRIAPGEKVALIGANGSGKSTFMNHLNGVEKPFKGRVSIDGLMVNDKNLVSIRRKVGIVFQDPDDQLFCATVADDVAFGPLNLGLPENDIQQRVSNALELTGLLGYEERSSFHLSFGERKRLALATVLSYQPDILVFDEPSTNMDPLNRRRLIEWLQSCDKTMLLCTHDMDVVLEVSDRCLLLAGGRIIADGPTSEILYNRELLEANHLEQPLALRNYGLLESRLNQDSMPEEHRIIIKKFLRTHLHDHDGFKHSHPHGHPHELDDSHVLAKDISH
jgi:cobalt transport protein ATP-binding subunit